MLNRKLLEKHIEKSGYRKKFLAQQLGITPYSFSLKLSGTCEFKGSEIKLLIQLLELSANEAQDIFFA